MLRDLSSGARNEKNVRDTQKPDGAVVEDRRLDLHTRISYKREGLQSRESTEARSAAIFSRNCYKLASVLMQARPCPFIQENIRLTKFELWIESVTVPISCVTSAFSQHCRDRLITPSTPSERVREVWMSSAVFFFSD